MQMTTPRHYLSLPLANSEFIYGFTSKALGLKREGYNANACSEQFEIRVDEIKYFQYPPSD